MSNFQIRVVWFAIAITAYAAAFLFLRHVSQQATAWERRDLGGTNAETLALGAHLTQQRIDSFDRVQKQIADESVALVEVRRLLAEPSVPQRFRDALDSAADLIASNWLELAEVAKSAQVIHRLMLSVQEGLPAGAPRRDLVRALERVGGACATLHRRLERARTQLRLSELGLEFDPAGESELANLVRQRLRLMTIAQSGLCDDEIEIHDDTTQALVVLLSFVQAVPVHQRSVPFFGPMDTTGS